MNLFHHCQDESHRPSAAKWATSFGCISIFGTFAIQRAHRGHYNRGSSGVQDNLRKAKDGLMAVRQALSDTADAAVKGLQTVMLAPKATYIACLAALLVMRQALKTICPWHRCRYE